MATQSAHSSAALRLQPLPAKRMLGNLDAVEREFTPPMDIRERVEHLELLPPIPEMTHRILEVAADPNAGARELAAVVELDPPLAAQVVRWATSPLYGFRGRITGVQDAIARVLGFDLVMNLALGLTALSPLRCPPEGPIGRHAVWRHAVYSGMLCASLSRRTRTQTPLGPGLAQLAGLLHNVGYLLLGHLFPHEFQYLNALIASNGDVPVTVLERFALGVDHQETGEWLLRAWQMPEPLANVIANHHEPEYRGPNDGYVHLVLVTDNLLRRHGIGDGSATALPAHSLEVLGLTPEEAENLVTADLLEQMDGLAAQLAKP
jgi:HD-like signal output (HDOD) protein